MTGLLGQPGRQEEGAPASAHIKDLIEAYAAARSVRTEAANRLKHLQAVEDQAAGALFDALEAQGLRSVRHELGLFSLNDLAWASITDPEKAREWALVAEPELITLNAQRLSKMIRDRLAEGEELPPGVDFRTTRKINWRGAPKVEGRGDGTVDEG